MKKKIPKEFDAVATMFEIRARLSPKTKGKKSEEEERFVREHAPKTTPRPFGQPRNDAAQAKARRLRRKARNAK